jgi:hypothetical protein
MFEGFMQANLGEGGSGGRSEVAHPADNGVNAAHFAADDFDEFGVLMLFEEQIHEGPASDEGILNFVGHAGGEGADAGQTIKLLDVLFDLAGGGEVMQNEHDAGVLPARVQRHRTGVKGDSPTVAGFDRDLAIRRRFARTQGSPCHGPEGRREGSKRWEGRLVRAQAEKVFGLVVERGDLLLAINEDHSRS